MSDESGSDGLSDWSVVSREGQIEAREDSSSSDECLKVSPEFEHGQDLAKDKTEQESCSAESAASSIHDLPTVLLESSTSSIEEEMSSTTCSSSSSDAVSSTTDLGVHGEDGKDGMLHAQSPIPVLDHGQDRHTDEPVSFKPDSPECLRLQALTAAQSKSYSVMQTIAVIQLANTVDLSSDSDSDFVHLDQSSSSGDSLYGDDLCDVQSDRVSPSVCDVEIMEKSVSSVSSCFKFMPQNAGQASVTHLDSNARADEKDGDTQSAIIVDHNQLDGAFSQDAKILVENTDAQSAINIVQNNHPEVAFSQDARIDAEDRGRQPGISAEQSSQHDGAFSEDVTSKTEDVDRKLAITVDQSKQNDGAFSQDQLASAPTVPASSPTPSPASVCAPAAASVAAAPATAAEESLDDSDQSSVNDTDDVQFVTGDVDQLDVHPPHRGISFTLNTAGLLIVSIAIAFALGHSIGSLRIHNSWIASQQEKEFELQNKLSQLYDDHVQLQKYYHQRQETIDLKEREITELLSHNKQLLQMQDQNSEKNHHLQEQNQILNSKLQYAESTRAVIRNENEEIKSRVQNAESKNVLLQEENEGLKSQLELAEINHQSWEDEHQKLLQLLDKKILLEKENYILKEEIEKFKHDSFSGFAKGPEGVQSSFVNEHDGGKKDVLVGLKNAVNQLEIENENLGDKIVRYRYKSHTTKRDTQSESVDSSYQQVIVKQLTVDLEREQAESKKWRNLYEAQKKNKTNVDGHSCLSLLCKHLNSSVNHYVNLTALLTAIHNISHSVADNVKDMKDVFFNEVKQNYESVKKTIFEESKPDDDDHYDDDDDDDEKQDEKSKTSSSRKLWINTVSEVLNKTRNSVANVTRQIQDTWVQVKNLSRSFWEKYEPSIVEVANKLSKKVADAGRKFHENIKKKASRWWRRQSKRDEKWQKTQKKMRNSFEKKGRPGAKTDTEYMNDKNLKDKRNKNKETGRADHRNEKDMMKAYKKMVKKMNRITVKKHQRMNSEDISNMCAMFSMFARLWDVNQWLSDTDRVWFLCQRDWWLDRRDGIKRDPRGCEHCLQDWQLDWEPSGFQGELQKKNKGGKRREKCNQSHKMSSGDCNEKSKYDETSEHQSKRHHEDDFERSPYRDDRNDFREKHHHRHDHKKQHHHHEGNPHHHHYHHGSESLEDDDDFSSLDDDLKTNEDPKENNFHEKNPYQYHDHYGSEEEDEDLSSLYDDVETMEDPKDKDYEQSTYHYESYFWDEEDLAHIHDLDDLKSEDYLEDSISWPVPNDGCKKPNKTFWSEDQQDWYLKLGKHRLAQHQDEHKSDWMFDRAADRKTKRSSTAHSSQKTFAKPVDQDFRTAYIDPKSEWLFSRADEREYHRSTPDNWYFQRYQGRMKKTHVKFDSYED